MPNYHCVFGGEPIESLDGESLEGVAKRASPRVRSLLINYSTGQREMRCPEPVEGARLGIYHYNARFYSPELGRFLSADTIVPGYGNPQNLNRFSYVRNNPLRYTDPTGHYVPCEADAGEYHHDPAPGGGGGGRDGCRHNDPDCRGGGGGGLPVPNPGPDPSDGEPVEPNLGGGGHPLLSPNPDGIIGCSPFDCALSAVSLIATAVAAVPGTIGLVGFGVDLVATVWAIRRTNDDYHQGEISRTRQLDLNISGGVGVLPGSILGEWAFPVSFVAGLANLLMTATGLPN